jgi:CRISPR-associated protein Cmr2
VRDLWTGSAILSWLTFQGLLPVVETYGPAVVIYPALRGTPLLDLWLQRQGVRFSKLSESDAEAKRVPCVPNRFLAIVPWGEEGTTARDLAERCETAVRDRWKELTEVVRAELAGKLSGEFPSWDERWHQQVESFFEIRTTALPERQCSDEVMAELLGKNDFADAWPNAAKVRKLAEALRPDHRPGYDQNSSGRWQAQIEISARLMEAERMVRHVPVINTGSNGREEFPPKCSLMGTYEQMGPPGLEESRQFWQKASEVARIQDVRLRPRERFCAIALAKRFAPPAFMTEELGIDRKELLFPDTATVAAAEWLEREAPEIDRIRRHGEWSGQWLQWERRDLDPDDECPEPVWKMIADARKRLGSESKSVRPPAYYAVLAMDGDSMGKWLRGDKAPAVSEVLHSKILKYYEGLSGTAEGLAAMRPLAPALHMALSEALTNFAVRIVPGIVRRHLGTVIYSGGDDLLALLPARTALACADGLRRAFRGERSANNGADEGYYRLSDGRDLLVMGPKATLSAGVAVVHYKEDLREALEAARSAERAAKDGGRNALQLAVWRRSGERASALCAWETVEQLEKWVQAFADGASDRWAYHLRAELPTLQGLPVEAIQVEIRRQVDRAEEETRRLLGEGDKAQAGRRVAAAFEEYRTMRTSRMGKSVASHGQEDSAGRLGHFLRDFLTLLQSASFLAWGREG